MKSEKVTIRSVRTADGAMGWVVMAFIGGVGLAEAFDHYPSMAEVDEAVEKMELS